jgi:hypothetical protein
MSSIVQQQSTKQLVDELSNSRELLKVSDNTFSDSRPQEAVVQYNDVPVQQQLRDLTVPHANIVLARAKSLNLEDLEERKSKEEEEHITARYHKLTVDLGFNFATTPSNDDAKKFIDYQKRQKFRNGKYVASSSRTNTNTFEIGWNAMKKTKEGILSYQKETKPFSIVIVGSKTNMEECAIMSNEELQRRKEVYQDKILPSMKCSLKTGDDKKDIKDWMKRYDGVLDFTEYCYSFPIPLDKKKFTAYREDLNSDRDLVENVCDLQSKELEVFSSITERNAPSCDFGDQTSFYETHQRFFGGTNSDHWNVQDLESKFFDDKYWLCGCIRPGVKSWLYGYYDPTIAWFGGSYDEDRDEYLSDKSKDKGLVCASFPTQIRETWEEGGLDFSLVPDVIFKSNIVKRCENVLVIHVDEEMIEYLRKAAEGKGLLKRSGSYLNFMNFQCEEKYDWMCKQRNECYYDRVVRRYDDDSETDDD